MNPVYLVNLVFYIGTLLLFAVILIKASQKYRTRKNRVTKWLFFVLLFYALSLSFVMINTILEYIVEIYPLPWYWGFHDTSAWYYYFQYILQFGCARDSMILIGNLFLAYFYYEIFVHERTPLLRVLLGVYVVATIIFVGIFLIIVFLIDFLQIGLSMVLPEILVLLPQSRIKLIFLLVHTAVIFIPLVLKSIILRHRLTRQYNDENQDMIRKFTYIFLMVLFFLGLFIFALLDELSPVNFSIWYYCTFISESLAAIMAYLGFIKDLKKK